VTNDGLRSLTKIVRTIGSVLCFSTTRDLSYKQEQAPFLFPLDVIRHYGEVTHSTYEVLCGSSNRPFREGIISERDIYMQLQKEHVENTLIYYLI
jgi:hypothetical protein